MNRLILCVLLLCGIHYAEAKVKVVESSARQAPEWRGGAEEESIITSSMSDISLEDAKRRAMEQVKVKMIESIAQNINYTSLSKIEQTSGDVNSFSDEFKSALLLNTARIPFISGISESKITDFYWEVREDKALGTRQYLYTIKYPLTHAQVEEYVAEFERIDTAWAQELEMLDSGYYNLSSIDEIGEAISKCSELEGYFFDAVRKRSASELKMKYSALYGRISVVTKREALGEAFIALQIGDRAVSATTTPIAQYDKELIQNLQIVPRDGGFELLYDPQYCRDDIPYIIKLSFVVGSRRVAHEVTFTKSSKLKVRLQPQGTVTLTAQNIKQTVIEGVQFQMDLMVEGLPANTPITVDVVTLRVPNLKDEFYFNKVSAKYVGSGKVTLLGLFVTPTATTGEASAATIKLLTGELSGYYGVDKTPFNSKFSRTYNCNW